MDLFREQGDKHSLAICLGSPAMMVYSQGDLGRATKLTEESIALFRELGSRGGVALGLYNWGWIALLQDDLGRAANLYRESLSLSWDAGMNPLVQMALEGVTVVPVAEVRFAFGYGYGSGRGRGDEAEGGPGRSEEGSGGGSGAGGRASAKGYFRISADDVRFEPVLDVTRLALAGIAFAAWSVFWIGRTIRAVGKRH